MNLTNYLVRKIDMQRIERYQLGPGISISLDCVTVQTETFEFWAN